MNLHQKRLALLIRTAMDRNHKAAGRTIVVPKIGIKTIEETNLIINQCAKMAEMEQQPRAVGVDATIKTEAAKTRTRINRGTKTRETRENQTMNREEGAVVVDSAEAKALDEVDIATTISETS